MTLTMLRSKFVAKALRSKIGINIKNAMKMTMKETVAKRHTIDIPAMRFSTNTKSIIIQEQNGLSSLVSSMITSGRRLEINLMKWRY